MNRRTVAVVALALAAGPSLAQPLPKGAAGVTRATIESNVGYKKYTEPAIQADLKLTDEQKAQIARIPDDLLAKHKDAIAKEQADNKAAAEKAAARAEEVQKKLDALLEKHLTTPQRKRLQQMAVQSLGYTTFSNPDVAKALALTDDQKAKFAELRTAGLEKARELLPDGRVGIAGNAPDRAKYLEASRRIAQETVAKMVETLTADQKKAWADLTGEPSEAAMAGPARATGVFPFSARGPGLPPGRAAGRQIALIQNEKALAELKVDKAAADALAAGWKEIAEESRDTARDAPAFGLGRGRIQFTIQSEAARLAAQVLTAAQTKRLEQIQLQLDGLNGLVDFGAVSRVLVKLTLTPAQAAKIDAALADAAKQTQALGRRPLPVRFFDDRGTPRETPQQAKARQEYESKSRAIEQKALADVLATFDAGQAVAWKELTGDPFDTIAIPMSMTTTLRLGGRFGTATTVAGLWASEGLSRQNRGNYAAALAATDEAIRLAPDAASHQLQKARLLASCPSDMVRDGKAALALARKAIDAKKEPTDADYAVLAAAYAEVGQFEEAVATQKKAIAALPPPPPAAAENAPPAGGPGGFADLGRSNRTATLKRQYEEWLKLYEEKKPYRMERPRTRVREAP